ncbi:unnamed protein product, partial [Prorocentrum cordatum]
PSSARAPRPGRAGCAPRSCATRPPSSACGGSGASAGTSAGGARPPSGAAPWTRPPRRTRPAWRASAGCAVAAPASPWSCQKRGCRGSEEAPPGAPEEPLSAVRPGTHWHEFCQLFGAVERVECAAAGGARERRVVTLLARFCQPEGAQNMYEALADRYLFRPWDKETDEGDAEECFQVTCALNAVADDLARALLLRGEPVLDSEVAFVLRRAGGAAPEEAAGGPGAPGEVLLTSSRPQLVLGREPGEGVDVVVGGGRDGTHTITTWFLSNFNRTV